MNLEDVHAIHVYRTQRRRVGRGWGSGMGKTSTRGEKGAGRRSCTKFRLRFEGGQMPLYRRLPKKGFSNHPFKVRYEAVNVGDLDRAFEAGTLVDLTALHSVNLVPKNAKLWKVLGDGTCSKALKVSAHAASAGAKAKIESAGGTLELIAGKHRERAEALVARRVKSAAHSKARLELAIIELEKAKKAKAEAPAKGAKGAKVAKVPKAEKQGKPEGGGDKPKGGEKPKGGGEKKGQKPEGGAKKDKA